MPPFWLVACLLVTQVSIGYFPPMRPAGNINSLISDLIPLLFNQQRYKANMFRKDYILKSIILGGFTDATTSINLKRVANRKRRNECDIPVKSSRRVD